MAGTWRRRVGPYLEIARTAWENRDRPGYAWRILSDGVCDGCALGTSGMKDWTQKGVHLCWIRLNLLRLNTQPALDPARLGDVAALRALSEPELRRLGRLPFPILRRRGDAGFTRVGWDEALDRIAGRLGSADPRRIAFYVVSRGTVNETYYAAQKAARALGTNHVDNSARVCHAPSTSALKDTLGVAASTVSYTDLIGTDLIVFFGSNPANNQPVLMKYLHLARKAGTRIAVVNPLREPGLERYWVPSTVESALLGTRIADAFFTVRVGGDIAFLNGVLKILIGQEAVDRNFIAAHTEGWDALEASLREQSLEDLAERAGVPRGEIERFARMVAEARNAVLVWSMGITMHRHGVGNVKAIVNLALARGFVGRPRAGLMAIRGHSGVQGGSEMGCVPNAFPGGAAVGPASAAALEASWGFTVPDWNGHFMVESVDAADRGELDVLYTIGSNLLGVLPDRRSVERAISRIPLRVHHDLVLNPSMLLDPADTLIVLPATTRYEMQGGNTETSTERRVIFNPEIPGPRLPEARDEWRVILEAVGRARPELADRLRFENTAAIRSEIARLIPFYDGIQRLSAKGDQFQWGGPRLAEDARFPTPDGRARFTAVRPPETRIPPGWFHLSTRRGKQFNSMVLGDRDLILDTDRKAVVLATADMERLGLSEGDPVRLRNTTGEMEGRAHAGPVHPGTVVLVWPEGNDLIPREGVDPVSGIPAYRGAAVEVLPVRAAVDAAR